MNNKNLSKFTKMAVAMVSAGSISSMAFGAEIPEIQQTPEKIFWNQKLSERPTVKTLGELCFGGLKETSPDRIANVIGGDADFKKAKIQTKRSVWEARMRKVALLKGDANGQLTDNEYDTLCDKVGGHKLVFRNTSAQKPLETAFSTTDINIFGQTEKQEVPVVSTEANILGSLLEDQWAQNMKTNFVQVRTAALEHVKKSKLPSLSESQLENIEDSFSWPIAFENYTVIMQNTVLPNVDSWNVRGWVKKYNVELLKLIDAQINGPLKEAFIEDLRKQLAQ